MGARGDDAEKSLFSRILLGEARGGRCRERQRVLFAARHVSLPHGRGGVATDAGGASARHGAATGAVEHGLDDLWFSSGDTAVGTG
jgi:hypothetical protein